MAIKKNPSFLSLKKERELVKAILENQPGAKEKFCTLFRPLLLGFVLKKTTNPEDAEEIVHDTLLSALDSLPTFRFRARLFSWLCAIACHETADFYRKKRIKTILFSRFPFLETIAHQALGPEGKTLREELQEEVRKTLSRLKREYALVLKLKYLEELSLKEIAARLKITPKAVESRLTRARRAFALAWEGEGKPPLSPTK